MVLEDKLYDQRGEGGSDGIYPPVLQGPRRLIPMPLELTSACEGTSAHYLDYMISFNKGGFLQSCIYDKRDNSIHFQNTRSFPHRQSTLSYKCKAGVLFSQLYRFERRSTTMSAFLERSETYFGNWCLMIIHRATYINKLGRSSPSPLLKVAGL